MRRAQATLAEVLEGAPLVVCLGPGGVGKTTVSAVLALHQAATGSRSLVLTIDPARRLADALSLPGLTNDPVEIHSFAKMHPGGALSALMLDPTATFDHLIALLVSDPARRQALLDNRLYQSMSRTLAGTLEYMAVERLYELASSGAYDSIVLDTPPTTNALDFLDAPDRLARFFSEKTTRWFLPAPEKLSWTRRLVHRAGTSFLGLLDRIAGASFVEETVGFFATFGDLLGHFRTRGIEVGKVLRDERTVFLIVCSPDPSRLGEAQELDRRLSDSGCHARAFIMNRVDEPFLPCPADGAADGPAGGAAGGAKRGAAGGAAGAAAGDAVTGEALARATALLGGAAEQARVRAFVERLELMRHTYESAAQVHARALAALRAYAGSRPVFAAPRVPPGESPRAALLAVYVGLFAGGRGAGADSLASTPASVAT